MNRLKELKELRKLAETLQLDNCQILRKYIPLPLREMSFRILRVQAMQRF